MCNKPHYFGCILHTCVLYLGMLSVYLVYVFAIPQYVGIVLVGLEVHISLTQDDNKHWQSESETDILADQGDHSS